MAPTQHPFFGFRTAGYRDWPLHQAFASIARAGFDGVEICLEHPGARPETLSPASAQAIAAQAHDAGLQVASVSYHADAEDDLPREQNQFRAIALTRPLGAHILILNARSKRPGHEAEQWDAFRALLERLLARAEAEDVLLALEPEPGHFLHGTAEMLQLLQEIPHPRLGVNLDVGHAFLTDPDVSASIRSLGSRIFHTHVEGMPAGEHRHLLPGEGDLDLRAVRDALDEVGYNGFYTVDLFNIAPDPDQWALRSRQALRQVLGC
jgi:sugar phosphate isomerase/epimerase